MEKRITAAGGVDNTTWPVCWNVVETAPGVDHRPVAAKGDNDLTDTAGSNITGHRTGIVGIGNDPHLMLIEFQYPRTSKDMVAVAERRGPYILPYHLTQIALHVD